MASGRVGGAPAQPWWEALTSTPERVLSLLESKEFDAAILAAYRRYVPSVCTSSSATLSEPETIGKPDDWELGKWHVLKAIARSMQSQHQVGRYLDQNVQRAYAVDGGATNERTDEPWTAEAAGHRTAIQTAAGSDTETVVDPEDKRTRSPSVYKVTDRPTPTVRSSSPAGSSPQSCRASAAISPGTATPRGRRRSASVHLGDSSVQTSTIKEPKAKRQRKKGPQELRCTAQGCQKVFPYQSKLEDHMKTHSDKKEFKCKCGKLFRRKRELEAHDKTHKKPPIRVLTQPVSESPKAKEVDIVEEKTKVDVVTLIAGSKRVETESVVPVNEPGPKKNENAEKIEDNLTRQLFPGLPSM